MSSVTSGGIPSHRTSLTVIEAQGDHREVIDGMRFAWSFRPHYHAGHEVVHILAGRASLRLHGECRTFEAGESIIVPAGAVHRFEPIDADGWSFTSQFVMPDAESRKATACCDEDNGLIPRIKTLLAERQSLRTDIARIADSCAMSKGYLSRRFRREAGTSLHDFHVLLAVHHAKALLKRGLSIVDAALDSGFYDQAHLTREFVRTYGFTPGNFRTAWLMALGVDSATRH